MRRVLIVGMVLLGICGLLVFGLIIIDAIRTPGQTIETDILVYGSSLGGTSAAIMAAEQGAKVVLAMESAVVGGQAVEAGVSAFDDLDAPWEQWGLYFDLQKYLREKRGSTDEKHFGLGAAVVGRVASIPADIEDFFRARIAPQKNITLLTEHTLLTVRRERWWWGPWREADLLDLRTQARLRVRFQYLVDGTPTGSVLAQTGTPFRIGFDAQEETGEHYALTTDQRRSFIEGMEWKGKQLGGFGNRVQAITSPFILLDRGYPGEFYPVSAPGTACRPPDTASGFIVGSPLFAIGDPTCLARIPVNPEFTDTYDLYIVHHGSGPMNGTVSSLRWPDHPIVLARALSANDTFTYIGTFPAAPNDGMTVSISADAPRILIEGIILVKRNIAPAEPLVFRSPLSEKLTLDSLSLAPVTADIYITGWGPSPTEKLILDNQPLTPSLSSPQTLCFSNVPLRRESTLTLPASFRSTGVSLIIIPKALELSSLTFQGHAPEREFAASSLEAGSMLSKTALPVREWSFVAPNDGDAVFLIQSDSPEWRLLELWSDEPSKRMETLSFIANNVTRNPRPLFSAPLTKGNRYRLRMAVATGGSWNDFSWSISFQSSSALLKAARSASLTVSPHGYEGIYDIWIKAPLSSDSLCTLKRPENPDRSWLIPVHHTQYEYAGKAYLDRSTTLSASQEVTSLLAIPNTHVDTFLHTISSKAPSTSLNVSTLPPGLYRATLVGDHDAPVAISASLQGIVPPQSLSFPVPKTIASPQLSPNILSNNGRLLTLTLPPGSSALRLFEDIPNLQDSWTFAMSHHPLMGKANQAPVPLFRFRNIVSPSSLLEGKTDLAPKYMGRNTAGVTLVINPSNDYAGVKAEKIDAQDLREASRTRSAAYAYWMKYDAALTQPNVGCDPSTLPCTPKRTRLVLGLFADPLSPFPPQPYSRESRRLLSSRTIRHEDLMPTLATCSQDVCPQNCQQIAALSQLCIPESQEPVLFIDALAAVGYSVDIHSFYSLTDYYYGVTEFLAALRERLGGTDPMILLPIWKMILARPAEVPLSALLARNGGNIFPAANNMGVSQIANGLYRTHVNEMAIGQAVGSLLRAALKQGVPPSEFRDVRLRSLQHALVERGFVLYPIEDMMTDLPLRTGVQHLIVEGLLTPTAVVPKKITTSWGIVVYQISPSSVMNEQDLPIVQALFPSSVPQPLTYRHLLSRLANSTPQTTDDSLRAYGLAQGLIDESHRALPASELLRATPSKGDLYRAASLLLRDRWSAATEK